MRTGTKGLVGQYVTLNSTSSETTTNRFAAIGHGIFYKLCILKSVLLLHALAYANFHIEIFSDKFYLQKMQVCLPFVLSVL